MVPIFLDSEKAPELERTLEAVGLNLREWCREFGSDAWKNVVAVIVVQGEQGVSVTTKAFLGALGLYTGHIRAMHPYFNKETQAFSYEVRSLAVHVDS